MIEYITQVDFSILDFIFDNLHSAFMDSFMVFLSMIGEGGAIWFLIAVPMLFFKKSRVCGFMMIVSMALTLLIGEFALKNLVGRVRPCNVNTDIELLVNRPKSFSFPSGHTGSSFTAATCIFIWKKRVGIFALVLAFLIAFSRLYNYVHFPSDILGGIVLGVSVSLLVYYFIKKYRFDNKIENLRFSRRS